MNKSLLILALLVSVSAEAGRDRVRSSEERAQRQQERIASGVRSGELTVAEQKRLERGQERIEVAQENAVQDGVVTPEEQARLHKMQDKQSKRIWKQKHDRQVREKTANLPE